MKQIQLYRITCNEVKLDRVTYFHCLPHNYLNLTYRSYWIYFLDSTCVFKYKYTSSYNIMLNSLFSTLPSFVKVLRYLPTILLQSLTFYIVKNVNIAIRSYYILEDLLDMPICQEFTEKLFLTCLAGFFSRHLYLHVYMCI